MNFRGGPSLADRARRGPPRAGRYVHRIDCRLEALEPRSLLSGPAASVSGADPIPVTAEIYPLGAGTDIAPESFQFTVVAVRPLQEPVVSRPEQDAPHRAVSDAQLLPNVAAVEVNGRLDSNDQKDMYRVPITAGTGSLRLSLRMDSPTTGSPMRVRLLDGAGQEQGRYPILPGTAGLGLITRTTGMTSDLFIEMSRPGPGSPEDVAATTYHLQVERPNRPATGPQGPGRPFFATPTSLPAGADSPGAAAPAPKSSPPPTDADPAIADPIRVATGPRFAIRSLLPLRTSPPSGGVLLPLDRTPPAERRVIRPIDLRPSDLAAEAFEAGADRVQDPGGWILPPDSRPDLARIRGPGLPVQVVNGRFLPRPLAVPAPPTALAVGAQDDRPALTTPGPPPAEATDPGDHPRTTWPLSVRAGMAVAVALAVGLMLPDLGVSHPFPRFRRPCFLRGRSRRAPRLGHL